MSAIRRPFSIEVIALVQDKVSTIQSYDVCANRRGETLGTYHSVRYRVGVRYSECPLKEVLLYPG